MTDHRAAVRRAVGSVLFNVSNFPEAAQSQLWGKNMGPLNEKVTDAVLAALTETPDWEYGTQARFEVSGEAYDAVEWGSREQAESVARDRNQDEVDEDGDVRLVYGIVKRFPAVPAGPWIPVEQTRGRESHGT